MTQSAMGFTAIQIQSQPLPTQIHTPPTPHPHPTHSSAHPTQDKAVFTLVCQSVETTVSLALMRVLTAGPIAASGASSPIDLDLFVTDPREPFRRPTGWAAWGLMGCVAAPAVVGITAALLSIVGWERLVEGGAGTVDGVTGLISLDTPTYLSLLAVTGVLAPVLEVGRGGGRGCCGLHGMVTIDTPTTHPYH